MNESDFGYRGTPRGFKIATFGQDGVRERRYELGSEGISLTIYRDSMLECIGLGVFDSNSIFDISDTYNPDSIIHVEGYKTNKDNKKNNGT